MAYPGERIHLTIEIVEGLIGENALCPDHELVDHIIGDWFSVREDDVAEDLIEGLVEDADAPVRDVHNGTAICVTDREAALNYVDELKEDDWSFGDRT